MSTGHRVALYSVLISLSAIVAGVLVLYCVSAFGVKPVGVAGGSVLIALFCVWAWRKAAWQEDEFAALPSTLDDYKEREAINKKLIADAQQRGMAS